MCGVLTLGKLAVLHDCHLICITFVVLFCSNYVFALFYMGFYPQSVMLAYLIIGLVFVCWIERKYGLKLERGSILGMQVACKTNF